MIPQDLVEWQRSFKRWVEKESLTPAELADFSDRANGDREGTRGVRRRLEIYRYAYRARLLESVEDDFPRLRAWMGEAEFRRLIERYLQEQPSRFASVADFSFPLADWMLGQKDFSSVLSHHSGALAELARFELEMIRIERAALAERFTSPIAPGTLPSLQLSVPVSRLILHWNVHEDRAPGVPFEPASIEVLLSYGGHGVNWMELDSAAREIWKDLEQDLARVGIDRLLERWTDREVDPANLQRWMAEWSGRGLLLFK